MLHTHMCCIEVSHQETENVLDEDAFHALLPGFPSLLVGFGAKVFVFLHLPLPRCPLSPPGLKTSTNSEPGLQRQVRTLKGYAVFAIPGSKKPSQINRLSNACSFCLSKYLQDLGKPLKAVRDL